MADNRTIGTVAALAIAGAGALALFLAVPGGGDTATIAPSAGEVAPSAGEVASGPAVELNWEDLVPGDDGFRSASGVVEHDQSLALPSDTPETTAVRAELDGKRVRLPGYMTPLDFENSEVSEFLLVPYVGACIHVPPPPSNQIVYVSMDGTVPVLDLWQPLVAEGTLRAEARSTELAEVGYTMRLSHMEIFEEDMPEVFDDTNGAEPPALDEPPALGGTELDAVFREANET